MNDDDLFRIMIPSLRIHYCFPIDEYSDAETVYKNFFHGLNGMRWSPRGIPGITGVQDDRCRCGTPCIRWRYLYTGFSEQVGQEGPGRTAERHLC